MASARMVPEATAAQKAVSTTSWVRSARWTSFFDIPASTRILKKRTTTLAEATSPKAFGSNRRLRTMNTASEAKFVTEVCRAIHAIPLMPALGRSSDEGPETADPSAGILAIPVLPEPGAARIRTPV